MMLLLVRWSLHSYLIWYSKILYSAASYETFRHLPEPVSILHRECRKLYLTLVTMKKICDRISEKKNKDSKIDFVVQVRS